MNSEEYALLRMTDQDDQVIWANSIEGPDRTLLYGYTVNRQSWHVYLRGGLIHLYVYDGGLHGDDLHRHMAVESAYGANLVPDKRVYPESTDYAFALRLKHMGLDVRYLPFDASRYARVRDRDFHGKLY